LRRILDRDREAADQLRTEMDALRERLAEHPPADDDYRSTPGAIRSGPMTVIEGIAS
jgi:hypothetical protein